MIKTQNTRTYLCITPILLLCGLIIYFDSSLNTCYGLVHGFRYLFLLLVLFVLLIIFLGIQIYKITKQAENRKNRIVASIIVVIATVIALQGKSTWNNSRLENSILTAQLYPIQHDIGQIKLLDNEVYYAVYGHIDWYCTFTGSYQKQGDTLILSGNPFEKSDGIIADRYILSDSTLIPVKTIDREMNRTDLMKFQKKN